MLSVISNPAVPPFTNNSTNKLQKTSLVQLGGVGNSPPVNLAKTPLKPMSASTPFLGNFCYRPTFDFIIFYMIDQFGHHHYIGVLIPNHQCL
jgi:hypothetical protein